MSDSSDTPEGILGTTELSGAELFELLDRQKNERLEREQAEETRFRFKCLLLTLWIVLAGAAYVLGQREGAGSTYANGIRQVHEYEEAAAKSAAFPFKIERQ